MPSICTFYCSFPFWDSVLGLVWEITALKKSSRISEIKSTIWQLLFLKVQKCRLENSPICSCSYKIRLWNSHFQPYKFLGYSPVKFVFCLKRRLLFKFCIFVNKHFAHLKCTCLKKWNNYILFYIWKWIYCKILIWALVYL